MCYIFGEVTRAVPSSVKVTVEAVAAEEGGHGGVQEVVLFLLTQKKAE